MASKTNSLLRAYDRKVSIGDIESMLVKGADIFERDDEGETLLHKAAGRGDSDLVKLLLHAGGDVNDTDNYGWTPLINAVAEDASKDEQTIRILLDYGADVNIKDDAGGTALHRILISADDENQQSSEIITKILIKAGADVNTQDNDGQTPLCAWYNGGNHTAGLPALALIHTGADASIEDNYGDSLLKGVMGLCVENKSVRTAVISNQK